MKNSIIPTLSENFNQINKKQGTNVILEIDFQLRLSCSWGHVWLIWWKFSGNVGDYTIFHLVFSQKKWDQQFTTNSSFKVSWNLLATLYCKEKHRWKYSQNFRNHSTPWQPHTVAIWTFTFHKKSGFVRVIFKANFDSTYKPNSSMFWSETQIY